MSPVFFVYGVLLENRISLAMGSPGT